MSLLTQRWRSRELVGDAKHTVIVRLRPGVMNRNYIAADRIDLGTPITPPLIYNGHNNPCWKAQWIPDGEWVALPNVQSVKWTRSFDVQTGGEQGTTTCTIVMDNIAFPQQAGVAGLYHTIDRGFFSPSRGIDVPPRVPLGQAGNRWQNVLNSGWQIEVWEGYGQGVDAQLLDTLDPATNSYAPPSGALSRTYTGVILDSELDSHPDQITITAQDFSVFLTDQRLAGMNKAWEIASPVTFADKARTLAARPLNADGWVLVNDAAEVVKMIFIWAGFEEWWIEPFGWSLFQPMVFGSDKYLIDVINDILQQGDYVFFMGAPTNDDRSIGVPHFEHINALDPPPAVGAGLDVTDRDMTEALDVKWDLSSLPYVIRYRGAITQSGGGTVWGFGIGGLTQRYEATYYPPWAGHWTSLAPGQAITYESATGVTRTSTILRHFMETMGVSAYTQLQSNEECLFACVLVAIQYALIMTTAQFQIPGVMPLDPNGQIGVTDEATATNSRVWITQIDSEHVTGGGENPGYWRMTISGSLMDTQEMYLLKLDYDFAYNANQAKKIALAPPSP